MTLFRSNSGKDSGNSDPDDIHVEELHDDEEDENWLRIGWEGEEYEDAWLMTRLRNIISLDDNE